MTPPSATLPRRPATVALVLSGGVALGAFHAGAYAALHPAMMPDWVAGASIGAITAAILAGNPPEQRVPQLQRFWDSLTDYAASPWPGFSWPGFSWTGMLQPGAEPVWAPWLAETQGGPLREIGNEASILRSHLLGRPGLFRPQLPGDDPARPGLYNLSPLRARLEALVDFGRLNDGPLRVSLAATDLVSGQAQVFDNRTGTRIGAEHVLASCALAPFFAPVEVEGRLFGDGGMSGNLPLNYVLECAASAGSAHLGKEGAEAGERPADDLLCFAVDLFCREGQHPRSLGAVMSRAMDVIFGNQSRRTMEGYQRQAQLRTVIATLGEHLPPALRDDPAVASLLREGWQGRQRLLLLEQRASLGEAGGMKVMDFSAVSLRERWEHGARQMGAALQLLSRLPQDADEERHGGLVVHEVPDTLV